jgi:DNA-binding transcriptional ArsR family regulator
MSKWKFISNHGTVLAYVAKHPDAIIEDIAINLKVRTRTVSRIIADLVEDGYLEKTLVGRSNHYRVNLDAPLRRPIMPNAKVRDLLATLMPLIEIPE